MNNATRDTKRIYITSVYHLALQLTYIAYINTTAASPKYFLLYFECFVLFLTVVLWLLWSWHLNYGSPPFLNKKTFINIPPLLFIALIDTARSKRLPSFMIIIIFNKTAERTHFVLYKTTAFTKDNFEKGIKENIDIIPSE